MTDLTQFRDLLAQRFTDGDFSPVSATLTLVSKVVVVQRVDADGGQVQIKWPDGTVDVLSADEIASLIPA